MTTPLYLTIDQVVKFIETGEGVPLESIRPQGKKYLIYNNALYVQQKEGVGFELLTPTPEHFENRNVARE